METTNKRILELEKRAKEIKERIDFEHIRFARETRDKREGLQQSLRHWAHLLNISAPYLSDIELGRRHAPLYLRKKIEAIK